MSSLNKQQYNASRPSRGISLVVAGAGTGKTKVLVEKTRNIISSGLAGPEEILLLTFSSRAALEIKNRIHPNKSSSGIFSGTFHSFCLNLLKNNAEIFIPAHGYKEFPEVIGQDRRDGIIRDLFREYKDGFLGIPADVAAGMLDGIGIGMGIHKKIQRLGISKALAGLGGRFREYKISHNLIDYNDLIAYAISLLSDNRKIRETTRERFSYILVDEFQDSSEDNFRLIKLLAGENLFLVGDDWQSIYGFRGSKIDYMIKTKRYFPDAVVHKLNVNYRSRKEILDISNRFIKKNKYRTGKKLRSSRGKGGVVRGYFVSGIDEEAEMIAGIIADEKKKYMDRTGSIAVLYRNNWQGSYVSKKLGLPDANTELMTIHSSKGLEFNSVIIAGVSDRIFPDVSADIEEERRLLYVALTRARDRLHVVHHRTDEGGLSVFAGELGLSAGHLNYN